MTLERGPAFGGAFDQPLPDYAGLDEFMQGGVDYRQVRPKISRATVITAQNDPIAPYQLGLPWPIDWGPS